MLILLSRITVEKEQMAREEFEFEERDEEEVDIDSEIT